MLVLSEGKYVYQGTDLDAFLAEANPLTAWQAETSGTIQSFESGTTSTEKEYLALTLSGQTRPAKILVVSAVVSAYGSKAKSKLEKGFDPNDLVGRYFSREKRKTTISKPAGEEVKAPSKDLSKLSMNELKKLAEAKGITPARSKAKLLEQLS